MSFWKFRYRQPFIGDNAGFFNLNTFFSQSFCKNGQTEWLGKNGNLWLDQMEYQCLKKQNMDCKKPKGKKK